MFRGHAAVGTLLVLLACEAEQDGSKTERASETRQTVGMQIVSDDIAAADLLVSLPDSYDAKLVVNGLSVAIHRALKSCGATKTSLPFGDELQLKLTLDGNKVSAADADTVAGGDCVRDALRGAELKNAVPRKVDVHVLLKAQHAARKPAPG